MTSDYRKFTLDGNEIIVTDEQYKIITAPTDTDMLVLACAGSGKSTTMICRTKYLIDHDVDPTRIMLTTFNVDASESLRRKLRGLFEDVPKITVGTLDSIAFRLYKRYFQKDYFVGVSEYATELLKYLESDDGSNITSKYDVVIFDEFQDINEIQYNIIKKFYDAGVKIILIGDDAQNIYQWRGSDVKYILNAKTFFPTIQTYNLSMNYRSSLEVVNFASAVIRNNKDQIVKSMLSYHGPMKVFPQIYHYYSYAQQSKDIIRDISVLIKNDIKPDSIAILSRTNYPIKNMEEEIEKYNKTTNNTIKYVSLITNTSCDTKPKITDGCVTLTTIHKAKGLEWEYVYFISCDDETIPSSLDTIGIQEERRLFYVAATRAKKYLKITFTRKTISRFIAEIDRKLYYFPGTKQEYFKYSDRRSHLPPTELDKLVCMIQENDIDMLRRENIIPSIKPNSTKVHDGHGYDSTIDDNYLHSDFNNFTSRVIVRTIGTLQNNESCCNDVYANILSNSITVPREMYNSYSKYIGQILIALPILHRTDSDMVLLQRIGNVDQADTSNVISVVRKMLVTRDLCGEAEPLVVPQNYIPTEFMRDLKNHYIEYKNIANKLETLMNSVYIISLCENICDHRRRLMHMGFQHHNGNVISKNSVYELFMKNITGMYGHILQKYIPQIINDKLSCNILARSGANNIDAVIKIFDKTKNKVIDIRCSTEESCKLEWFVESLGQVALLREKKHIVNEIEIYNPLTGITHNFDVTCWNKDTQLLKALDHIRTTREMRNSHDVTKKSIEAVVKEDSPLINIPKGDALYDDIGVINEMIRNIGPIKIPSNTLGEATKSITQITHDYTRQKECESQLCSLVDKYSDKLTELKKNYEQQVIVQNEMQRCVGEMKLLVEVCSNRNKIPYYIVFDTETTGLPFTKKSPEVNLKAYDKSRILQLSWAIYDKCGSLINIKDYIIKPVGYHVSATHIHGITERIASNGHNISVVMKEFQTDMNKVDYLLGHNVMFDVNILKSEMLRKNNKEFIDILNKKNVICTMKLELYSEAFTECQTLQKLAKGEKRKKYPKQSELYKTLLEKPMENAHNAKYDTLNLGDIVREMRKKEILVF